ncbi:MAG TPA: hypothetical protein VMV16_00500 [Solirubrobacteraceae bacterium]|nr:hypothetical protein [Solirubrobacteraceae bacterium]
MQNLANQSVTGRSQLAGLDEGHPVVAEQAGTGGNAGIGARVGLKILAESVKVAHQAAATAVG